MNKDYEFGFLLYLVFLPDIYGVIALFSPHVHFVLTGVVLQAVSLMILGAFLKYKDIERFKKVSEILVYWSPSVALIAVMFISINVSVIYMMLAILIIGTIFVTIAKIIGYKYDKKRDNLRSAKEAPIKIVINNTHIVID